MMGGGYMLYENTWYCKIANGDKVHMTLPITGKDHGKSKIDPFTG